jgi:hypothetical protein
VGRNYIRERTISDPRERAADKKQRATKARQRRLAEAASIARFAERSKWCATGCGQPASPSWMGCCSEGCFQKWMREADRRDEVRQARKVGVPVAEWRKLNKERS